MGNTAVTTEQLQDMKRWEYRAEALEKARANLGPGVHRWRVMIGYSDLSPTAKAVAHAISCHALPDMTTLRNMSRWMVEQDTGYSDRTVAKALKELRDSGWLEVHRPPKPGVASTVYRLVEMSVSANPPFDLIVASMEFDGTLEKEKPKTWTPSKFTEQRMHQRMLDDEGYPEWA